MLTKMILTNFLSFKNRIEFDFTASKSLIKGKTNVYNEKYLKGALLIGPNASGKSNALQGISFLIRLIKGEGMPINNYKCIFSNSPIMEVEYVFEIDNREIDYKIEFDIENKNINEILKLDDKTVLEREGKSGQLRIDETVISDDQVDNGTMFLRVAAFNTGRFPQEPTLRKFIDFLQNSYAVDGYNRGAILGSTIRGYAEEFGVDKVNEYLEKFKYDFVVEYGHESEGLGLKASVGTERKIIFFKRKSFPIPSAFFRESQGNQVFLDLLPNLIKVIENPGMLIIDEFGNSLHNRLAEKIIAFFMEEAQNSQMFITSHHTNLISNSVFRPDQINLVLFADKSGSKVERLSKFKPREAQNLEKMYLGGMFEGLPSYE